MLFRSLTGGVILAVMIVPFIISVSREVLLAVPEDQREIFDELMREGGTHDFGPGSALIHVPKVRKWEQAMNRCLRNESSLPKSVQELAMLVTARTLDCQYIWNAHAASARRAGVSDALVVAMRDRTTLPALAPEEAVVVNYAREFFSTHRESDATFQSALELFGRRGTVELAAILGSYSGLALIANSFEVDLSPKRSSEPLMPV